MVWSLVMVREPVARRKRLKGDFWIFEAKKGKFWTFDVSRMLVVPKIVIMIINFSHLFRRRYK